MRRAAVAVAVLVAMPCLPQARWRRCCESGSYHGIKGQFTSIQAAVNAARPGDWILIGPGDYKTTHISTPTGAPQFPAAVLITTPDLHIRGMNRGTVIVDGTRPGSAACSNQGSAQNFGLRGSASSSASPYAVQAAGGASGVNGLMVWKAGNVSIENLTACNFLGGAREAGNEIWWNGGAESGKVGGHGFTGSYLTATSTYLKGKSAAGEFSARPVRRVLEQLERRHVGSDLRLQLQRLGLLHRGLPPGLRPDRQPRLGRVQRPGLLGLQLRRPPAHRELAVRQQRGRLRHQQPERRQPRAAGRRLPGRGVTAGQGRPLLLGVHPQQRP